jgi:hypothetical protein
MPGEAGRERVQAIFYSSFPQNTSVGVGMFLRQSLILFPSQTSEPQLKSFARAERWV